MLADPQHLGYLCWSFTLGIQVCASGMITSVAYVIVTANCIMSFLPSKLLLTLVASTCHPLIKFLTIMLLESSYSGSLLPEDDVSGLTFLAGFLALHPFGADFFASFNTAFCSFSFVLPLHVPSSSFPSLLLPSSSYLPCPLTF